MSGKGQLLSFLSRQLSRINRQAEALLGPSLKICLFCNGRYKNSPYAMDLCQACFHSIPWITTVACPICGRWEHCPDCVRRQPESTFFIRNRSAVKYDAVMKELLAQYKYRGRERLLPLFTVMFVHAFHLQLQAESLNAEDFACITYVPVSRERLAERGFDQAERFAAQLADKLKLPVIPLLTRTRNTPKQSFKTRRERLDDLQGAFALLPESGDVGGRETSAAVTAAVLESQQTPKILLVDDVYTTGSTMNQCSRLLHDHYKAQVYGLTWAR